MSCKNCMYYKAMYSKTNVVFSKLRLYYCTKKEIVFASHGIEEKCEYWCKKQNNFDLSDKHFEDAEKAILEMIKMKEFN